MIKKALRPELIKLQVNVNSWQEAITAAGQILEQNNLTTPEYTQAMIQSVVDLGPYIVIMPEVAFAHARPGDYVFQDCISMITLAQPVEFGNEANDPVKIVFALGARSTEHHIGFLQDLVAILSEPENIELMKNSTDKIELLDKLLNK